MTTRNSYIGNGTQDTFVIGFDYLKLSFVKVTVDGVLQVWPDDYILLLLSSGSIIQFTTPPADGAEIVFQRITSTEPVVTFVDPSILTSKDLNTSNIQPLHILEERAETALDWDGEQLDLQGGTIINMGDPVNPTDAVTKQYVDDADDLLLAGVESNTYDIEILNNRVDGIVVGGVLISAEDGNAIEVKSDGLFVLELNDAVQGLLDDGTAQWIKINDTVNNVNALTTRTTAVEGVAGGNTTAIAELDDRVVGLDDRVDVLESAPSGGGGFNTREVIQTSGDYTPSAYGWYKVTVIGGGGGGSNPYVSGETAVMGHGGGAAEVTVNMVHLSQLDTMTITIGAGGGGGGGTGGTSVFTKNALSGIGANETFSAVGGAGPATGGGSGTGGYNGVQWMHGGAGANGYLGFGSGGGGGAQNSVRGGQAGRGAVNGTSVGGSGSNGAVILEYYNPNL